MARHLAATAAPPLLTSLVALGLLGGALTACAGPEAERPNPSATTEATGAADGAAEPTPTAPAPEPTPAPSTEDDDGDVVEEPPAAPVALTGDGVGDIPDGTPDALAAVEALLGQADRVDEAWLADCGAPWITAAWWGDVAITFNDGALYGWQTTAAPTPANVALPHGVQVGDSWSEVTALEGVSAPEFLDNFQVFTAELDGVQWWADADAPDSPVTAVGHGILGCG